MAGEDTDFLGPVTKGAKILHGKGRNKSAGCSDAVTHHLVRVGWV